MSWNYRVLKKEDSSYKIIEVYYEDGVIFGWADLHNNTTSDFEDLSDLKETVLKYLPEAFNKPVLEKVESGSDKLREIIE